MLGWFGGLGPFMIRETMEETLLRAWGTWEQIAVFQRWCDFNGGRYQPGGSKATLLLMQSGWELRIT